MQRYLITQSNISDVIDSSKKILDKLNNVDNIIQVANAVNYIDYQVERGSQYLIPSYKELSTFNLNGEKFVLIGTEMDLEEASYILFLLEIISKLNRTNNSLEKVVEKYRFL